MKVAIFGVIVGFAIVISAPTANAQVLEIFGEFPLLYNFDEGGRADSVLGFTVGVRSFVVPVGIGFDRYTIEGDGGTEIDVEIYNIFYASAFPIFELAIGAGIGRASYDSKTSSAFDDATLFQWYLNAGYPIKPLLGVFVGIHNVSGTGSAKTSGASDLDVSGRMFSIGIRFGF